MGSRTSYRDVVGIKHTIARADCFEILPSEGSAQASNQIVLLCVTRTGDSALIRLTSSHSSVVKLEFEADKQR